MKDEISTLIGLLGVRGILLIGVRGYQPGPGGGTTLICIPHIKYKHNRNMLLNS